MKQLEQKHFFFSLLPYILLILIQFHIYSNFISYFEKQLSHLEQSGKIVNSLNERLYAIEELTKIKLKPKHSNKNRVEEYSGISCKECHIKNCECLTYVPEPPLGNLQLNSLMNVELANSYIELMKEVVLNRIYEPASFKIDGNYWPSNNAMSMAGLRRINQVQALLEDVIGNDIPGDFIETGAWRGGICAVAAAIFTAYDQWGHRKVWIADSFQGIPPVNTEDFPKDAQHKGADSIPILKKNSEELAKGYFKTLKLERPEIKWLVGWFKDTLPRFKQNKDIKFAVIRLDGDIYESTIEALEYLYPSLSVGGYAIIDDYTDWIGCKEAVLDYRMACGISDEESPLVIGFHKPGEVPRGIYWKKLKEVDPDCWKKTKN